MRKAAHATMGPKPLTLRARIALLAALGLALFALGPMADAQTTSSIPTAENAKSKSDKAAKSDPKATKTASKSSETSPVVTYNGPASAADVARIKTAVGLARQGKTSQATDEQHAISDPAARKL